MIRIHCQWISLYKQKKLSEAGNTPKFLTSQMRSHLLCKWTYISNVCLVLMNQLLFFLRSVLTLYSFEISHRHSLICHDQCEERSFRSIMNYNEFIIAIEMIAVIVLYFAVLVQFKQQMFRSLQFGSPRYL